MVLVIALGNPLRQDDGAAGEAVRGLAGARPGLEVLVARQLLPEHAEPIGAARGVVFVDARDGGPPGSVAVEPVEAGGSGLIDPHAIAPGRLLAIARDLHGSVPPAALVTVGAARLDPGEGLSPEVAAALPAVRAAVLGIVELYESGSGPGDRREGGPCTNCR